MPIFFFLNMVRGKVAQNMTFRLVHLTLTRALTRTRTHTLSVSNTLCENTQSKVQNQKVTLACDLISRIVATYCKTLFYPFNISRHYPFTEQNIYFCLISWSYQFLKFSQGAKDAQTHSVFQKTMARHTTITFPLTHLPIPSFFFLVTSSKKQNVGNIDCFV